jgi:hypothetical protein
MVISLKIDLKIYITPLININVFKCKKVLQMVWFSYLKYMDLKIYIPNG